MMRFTLTIAFSFFMGLTQVWAQSTVTSEGKAAQKKWRAVVDLSHTPESRRDQEPTSDVQAIGDYFLTDKHRVRVMQWWQKQYSKYDSEYEFQAFNTALYHYYAFEDRPLGASYIWRNQVDVPISDVSVQDDLITRFTSTMFISKTFFKNKVWTSVRPFARYHWYKYRTSPGGRLLPLYTFGASALASYSFDDHWSILGTAYYAYEGVNSSQYDPKFVQREDGFYAFSATLNYQYNKHFGFYTSYGTGLAQFIVDGRYEVFLYDPLSSRYSLGVTAIF